MDKLVIIDGNSLINRAFYALPLLSNSKGEFSNGVYGFANILIKAILEIKPKYLAVALDYGKKTFRNKMFSGYKAKRKPTPNELISQFPILKEMLNAMNITYIEKEGYEADDIIGTLTKKFDTENIIITGDRDALQLISSNTTVWLTKRGITETKVMDEVALKIEYGLEPYQIIELKSLMGDSSDNIPGVGGIGEKTALNLLSNYTSLQGVYDNIEAIKGKVQEKLLQDKDSAFLSKELATINCNVPITNSLQDFEYSFPFSKQVFDFFKNYEFNSLIKKADLFEELSVEDNNSLLKYTANRIELIDVEELKQQIKYINVAKAFNFELNNDIFSFAYDKNCEFYCKVQPNLLDNTLDIVEVLNLLKPVFEDENIKKNLYDLKASKHILSTFNISLKGAEFDAILAYYLLCAGERDATRGSLNALYGLDEKLFGVNLFYLQEFLTDGLKQNNLIDLYNNIEFPLINVLYEMENEGFKIDVDILNDLSNRYSQEVEELSQSIKRIAGFDFNLNSPKQLGEVLFDKLGLTCYNNKKKSTSMEHLQDIYDLHPIVPAIIRYRKIQKIYTTYIEAYKNIVKVKDSDVIHTVFNQTLTSTGRLSSSEPNLQNLPIRDDEGKTLRKMFVSRYKDGALVSADYSQIELRLLAHMSEDETLIDAFNNNLDIHSLTASEVFGVDISLVTPEMRRTAKAVNFGIIYGISQYGLSQNINTSVQQAQKYIQAYFNRYPKIKDYMNGNVENAKSSGYAYSIFNRRRKINELFVPKTRMFGERIAMNMPLQGSASDIIKLAMINVSKALKEQGLKSKLIMQVHDELIIDAQQEEITTVAKILKDNMQNVVKLSVPLTVDVNSGKSWFDC